MKHKCEFMGRGYVGLIRVKLIMWLGLQFLWSGIFFSIVLFKNPSRIVIYKIIIKLMPILGQVRLGQLSKGLGWGPAGL